MKLSQLESGGPPGGYRGAAGWRAVTRVLRSWSTVRSAVHATTADLANVLLPSDCHLCGAPLLALVKTGVCQSCIARVGLDAGSHQDVLCGRCGDALGMESARFASARGVTECTMCRLAPPPFQKAVAFATYDNEMREMLHLLKFAGKRQMAEHVLGDRLAATMLKLQPLTARHVLVIPVPLFAGRQRERGFNQAEVLAAAAIKRLRHSGPTWKLELRTGLLQRVKDTRALNTLNPAQRRRSLVGAFRVADFATGLQGREVLLVDDIMTTGATARACAGVLLRAGAAKVWVATVAKAQPEGVRSSAQSEPYGVALWSAPARTRVIEPDIGSRQHF